MGFGNGKSAAYITIKKERVIVETPYNEAFINDLKEKCFTRKWDAGNKCWTVNISEKHIVIELVKRYFDNIRAYLVEGVVTSNLHTGEVY